METLNKKLEAQKNKIDEIIEQEKHSQEELSHQIDEEMNKLIQNIKNLNQINQDKINNPIMFGLSQKISEFNTKIAKNTEIIRKNKEEIPELQRKKKESEDFFNKFMGEKKVWLDRLSEKKIQKIGFEKGFKYFYEAKTIKLLLEGILLEKAEDEVEHELSKKGEAYGWDIMNIEKYESARKKKEFEKNLELAKISDDLEAINQEKEFKEKMDLEENETKRKRNDLRKEWQEIWGEIWVPNIPYNGEQDLIPKRELIQKVIMEVTFNLFKTKMFDIYKFKNVLNNTDQYIILEKIKKYLNEANETNDFNINHINIINSRRDEDAFQKMTNIIENIRREEEIIYCDLTQAKKKLDIIQKSGATENNDIYNKITNLVQKIEEFQTKAEAKPTTLLKREVEEINALIKELPDDNDKKLFQDNIKDESRLYDVFLPLTTLLMIITYLSVGKKRSSNYQNKLQEINDENEKLELEIEEIKGKLNTLNELNEKIKGDEGKEELISQDKEKDSLDDLLKSFMTQQNNILKQNNQLFNDIKSNLIQPEN
jgi:hypothetical protein